MNLRTYAHAGVQLELVPPTLAVRAMFSSPILAVTESARKRRHRPDLPDEQD